MINVKDLRNVLSDDLLNDIYEKRCEKLSIITLDDEKNIKDLLEDKNNAYEFISIAISNIPNAFVETRKMIKESIDKYVEVLNSIGSYENEKFYKCGFCDGMNIRLKTKIKEDNLENY